MGKMIFSNESTRVVFAERSFDDFKKLMFDSAMGSLEVEKKVADAKIREIFQEVLGVEAGCDRKTLKKAIRRHQIDIYEIIEEVVPSLLVSGWGNDPFFNEFVDMKSMALGQTNEFYVEDDSILTVSEVSGNHHDFKYRVRIA